MFNPHPLLLLYLFSPSYTAIPEHHKTCTLTPNTRGFGTVLTELPYTNKYSCFTACTANKQCQGVSISPHGGCQLIGADFQPHYQRFWSAAPLSCFNGGDDVTEVSRDSDDVTKEGSRDSKKPDTWLSFNNHGYVMDAVKSGEDARNLFIIMAALFTTIVLVALIFAMMSRRARAQQPGEPVSENSENPESRVTENPESRVIENPARNGAVLPSYEEAAAQTEPDLPPKYDDVVISDIS